jgi:hypothetical protein
VVHALEGPAYFLAALAAALVALQAPLGGVLRPIKLIGKYALFSFVAHRIILQVLHAAVRLVHPHSPAVLEYLLIFPGTMVVIWVMCRWRRGGGIYDRALKRVFL